jgi:hypothetical protein
MAGSAFSSLDRLQRKPLAACVTAVMALSLPSIALAVPTTWTVDSCDQGNSGDLMSLTGTLRFAVENAASGDIIDMTGLACGTISLSTGSIHVDQDDLAIFGPGRDLLTISGKFTQNTNTYSDQDRIFRHNGSGTLALYDLTVSDGDLTNATGLAKGGCVYSKGDVFLYETAVRNCSAKTTSGNARGAGIYTTGDLIAVYATIESNTVASGSSGVPAGGGAFSAGALVSIYSTIQSNTAKGPSGQKVGVAGGAFVGGNLLLASSTISSNSAARNAGGLDVFSTSPLTRSTQITESTISGNSAGYLAGGMYTNTHQITIGNSTVAFNSAGSKVRQYGSASFGAGVTASALYGSLSIDMTSTLISNNTVKTKEFDLSTPYSGTGAAVTFNSAPAANLVRLAETSTHALLPADTIDSCPLLGPLRANGGPTPTHALLSTSLAIDTGLNPAMDDDDQRGAPYARVSGPSADIGAYEVQQDDIVFNGGFDGCIALP